jgi:CRISPR/Cas system-associated endonuclease Cas3-HD
MIHDWYIQGVIEDNISSTIKRSDKKERDFYNIKGPLIERSYAPRRVKSCKREIQA